MSTTVDLDYSPSYIVRQTHDILHLDSSLNKVDNTFAITYDSQWNDYSKSLIPIPAICMVLGLSAIVILQLVLCLRICFKNCRCLPKITASGQVTASTVNNYVGPRYNLLFWLFIAFAGITILVNHILFFGSSYLTEGVNTSKDALDFVQSLSSTLNDQGNNLLTYGSTLQSDLYSAAPTCPPAQQLGDAVTQYYTDYVNEYLDYVSPLPGQCSDASDGLNKWGEDYKNSSIWALYAFFMIVMAVYCIGVFFKNKIILQIGIAIAQILMIIMFIFIGVEMVILIGLGDFCMEPINNVQQVIPRSIYNITDYYSYCTGQNPLSPSLSSAYDFVNYYNDTITYLISQGCTSNTGLLSSLGDLATINGTLNSITAEIACPPIQNQLANVLNDGLCDQAFQGIYSIWMSQYLTTSNLLVVTIVVSLVYQYFGQYWGDINVRNAEADNNIFITENPIEAQATNEYYHSTSAKTMNISFDA